MISEPNPDSIRSPQIALVGTTRAGKSVFTTVLAKYLERKKDGVRLSPKGGTPKSTYAQIDEWWNTLQTGNWLPATTPGTLIELQWDFCVNDEKIPLKMFDYAGETLTDLFSGRKDDAVGAAKEFFGKVRSVFENASVLLVLINLESFIEKDLSSAGENKGTLVTAMSTFLERIKREGRACRVCFVFTAYDLYKPLIMSRWGSVKNFLEQEIPPLYYEFVDQNSDVKVIPVAAVSETEARVDPNDGRTLRYPKPGFNVLGFDPLVKWLAEAVGSSKVELEAKKEELSQDKQNEEFMKMLEGSWAFASGVYQLEPIDRFLAEAGSSLPYPDRPNAVELEQQRAAFVAAAMDLRTQILERIASGRRDLLSGIFTLGLIALVAIFTLPSVVKNAYLAYSKRVEDKKLEFEKAEAERNKGPKPEIVRKGTWDYICNKGIFDCWEHRATMTVGVENKGNAGNVKVTFKLGDQSNSAVRFFNKNEISDVAVTISNLSNHTSSDATVAVNASN
jgi:hypothetical protein